jgi:hypothetical protein
MKAQNNSAFSAPKKNKWAERLRGKTRMAVASIGGVFLLGFLGVAQPLSQRIDAAQSRLAKAESRMILASDVSDLRRQSAMYQKRLPRGIDQNDWTQYILSGVRSQRVKISRMEPKEQTTLGPCKALSWMIELEGDFESLAKVVAWLENGKRLVRIDRLAFNNPNGRLGMSMLLKGLVVDTNNATTKPAGNATTKPAAGAGRAK